MQDTDKIAEARPNGIPPVVWKLLESRGLHQAEEREKLLKSSLADMRDPSCLSGVDLACERFAKALQEQETVCVYGDFDLDGSSGLALSVDALKRMGFKKVKHYQPKRLSEGYGVHVAAIEKLFHEEGVSLLFTVDVGITAIEAVDKANELGMDVIISDHHLAKEELPKALTIINPNIDECNSGLGHLCGAGVAFYVMLALRRHLKEQGLLDNDFNPKDLLDLFIIGTLTDMVPLQEENRTLTKHGLKELENTKRPGLKILLKELGYEGKELSGQDVAIGIAPKLNALSRLEMGIMPVDVLMAETEDAAKELVSQVLHLNSLRKKLQEEAEKDADKKYNENKTENFAFVWSESYHKGVVGLVATKLSQNYGVPAFVACCDVDGKLTGSGRVPDGADISLPEALDYCSEYLEGFGGHAQAAGFHLLKENVEAFSKKLAEYFEPMDMTKVKAQAKAVDFDIEAGFSEVDTQFMKWMDVLGPFGQEFPVPVLMFKNVQILNARELRGGHLKWKLLDPNKKAYSFDALLFSPSQDLKQWKEGDFVSVAAQVQWNYFAGRKSIQLLVQSVIPGESQ
jgi:single-stranded-DNA-specific exonuclease